MGELHKVRVTAIAVFAREALVGTGYILGLENQNMDAAEDPSARCERLEWLVYCGSYCTGSHCNLYSRN